MKKVFYAPNLKDQMEKEAEYPFTGMQPQDWIKLDVVPVEVAAFIFGKRPSFIVDLIARKKITVYYTDQDRSHGFVRISDIKKCILNHGKPA